MKTNSQLDKYIKHQVESIEWDGAEAAWESFNSGVGKDVIAVIPRAKFQWFSLRYLSLVILLLSAFGLVAFIAIGHEEQMDDEVIRAIAPANIQGQSHLIQKTKSDDQNGLDQWEENKSLLEEKILDETQNLESNPTNGPTPPTADPGSNTDASNNGPLAMAIPPTPVNKKTEASNFNPNTSAKVGSETAVIASIDRLAVDFLAKEDELLEWDRSNILAPQHKVLPRIFAELAAGRKSTGIELLAGLQVPYRSWNLEVGLGLRTQYQSPEDYTLETPSTSLPDFVDGHTFNYSRKLDFVAPVRLRKRLKNHAIFAGLKFIKNLSNTLEINSSIASEEYSLSKPIDQITYRNQLTILNNYTSDVRTNQGIISYSDWNIETSLGYEYQFGRCALGGALTKQIVPDFQLRSNESNKTLLESKPDLSLAIHLKYYI